MVLRTTHSYTSLENMGTIFLKEVSPDFYLLLPNPFNLSANTEDLFLCLLLCLLLLRWLVISFAKALDITRGILVMYSFWGRFIFRAGKWEVSSSPQWALDPVLSANIISVLILLFGAQCAAPDSAEIYTIGLLRAESAPAPWETDYKNRKEISTQFSWTSES